MEVGVVSFFMEKRKGGKGMDLLSTQGMTVRERGRVGRDNVRTRLAAAKAKGEKDEKWKGE